MRPAVDRQRSGGHTSGVSLTATAVERCIAVQYLPPRGTRRHAHTIVVPRHWRKVADKECDVCGFPALSEEANDATLGIAGIHPLKAEGIEVGFKERRLTTIERVQIANPPLQSAVEGRF